MHTDRDPLRYGVLVILISIAFFFGALSYEVINIGNDLRNDVHAVTENTNTQVNNIATAATAQISKIDKTQQQLDKLLVNTKRLIQHADITSVKEAQYLDSWNGQITRTLSSVNDTVVALTKNQSEITKHTVQTLDATTATIKDLQPLEAQSTSTVSSFQKFIDDPDIHKIVANTEVVTDQTAQTMAHVNGTTSEVQQYMHGILHPTWPHRVVGALKDTAGFVVKVFL